MTVVVIVASALLAGVAAAGVLRPFSARRAVLRLDPQADPLEDEGVGEDHAAKAEGHDEHHHCRADGDPQETRKAAQHADIRPRGGQENIAGPGRARGGDREREKGDGAPQRHFDKPRAGSWPRMGKPRTLFFDGPTNPAQVLAKGGRWIGRPPGKKIGKVQLRTQRRALAHLFRLGPLGVSN